MVEVSACNMILVHLQKCYITIYLYLIVSGKQVKTHFLDNFKLQNNDKIVNSQVLVPRCDSLVCPRGGRDNRTNVWQRIRADLVHIAQSPRCLLGFFRQQLHHL